MPKYYAGIGSRETPKDICLKMAACGKRLSNLGFILRSGGAVGADQAFEAGVVLSETPTNMQVFIPWNGYENKQLGGVYVMQHKSVFEAASRMVSSMHPAWDYCSAGARKMHTRNCSQVLGASLNEPAEFILCWTPCGSETVETLTRKSGGTAMAIRVACANGIPVFNMKNEDALTRLAALIAT